MNGKMFRIFEEVVELVFLLNLIEDLEALMDCPDHKQYFLIA
jgi:hypothetical protein